MMHVRIWPAVISAAVTLGAVVAFKQSLIAWVCKRQPSGSDPDDQPDSRAQAGWWVRWLIAIAVLPLLIFIGLLVSALLLPMAVFQAVSWLYFKVRQSLTGKSIPPQRYFPV